MENSNESQYPAATAHAKRKTAAVRATGIDNFPEAIGRFDFLGWFLSASMSRISLMIYTLPDNIENKITPEMVRNKVSGLVNCRSKTKAAKMNPFFTHWRGRIDLIIAHIIAL